MRRLLLGLWMTCAVLAPQRAPAAEAVRLATSPALSPDGKWLAFAWRGDLWLAPSGGGSIRRLTAHPQQDRDPVFSPDGQWLAFVSERSGSPQVYVMPAAGGAPRQLTFHSEGHAVHDWFPDGTQLLLRAPRDHFWRRPERFLRLAVESRQAPRLLFDDYGDHGRLSPDGTRLLFTREGTAWWRKGYRGTQASQIWLYDLRDDTFQMVLHDESECRYPLWDADGQHFYYVGGQSGAFNLYRRHLHNGSQEQLTHFDDDSVVTPCIARDGSVVVFRHLFDLYRLRPGKDRAPRKIELTYDGDAWWTTQQRRTLDRASDVAFTADGLELAFIAGGDLWVMDTVLREPRQVTATPEEERDPVFSPDGQTLYFVSDSGGQCDIWTATRSDPKQYWWQNTSFTLRRLTDDPETESDLRPAPRGELLAYVRGRGDLYVMRPDGTQPRCIVPSWNRPEYDWSPDGKWFVYAVYDEDFNRDVWIAPLDGSREPYNLSRHPDNDGQPVWSPDGKLIAYVGTQAVDEVGIHFVYLQQSEHDRSARDRRQHEAVQKIARVRKDATGPIDAPPASGVLIDFDDLYRRVRRVSLPGASPSGLFWKFDSSRLAFAATIDGQRGTYTMAPPDELRPTRLSTATGSKPRWISQGNQIVWLSGGVPQSVNAATGAATGFPFSARQVVDLPGVYQAAFDQCWRAMRDHWYDGRLNNRNWDAIGRKYRDMARQAGELETLARVVSLMLGELNGSHLGFVPRPDSPADSRDWREVTPHLGLRFDEGFPGPGLRVRDVLPQGPATRAASRIAPGEVVLAIDGQRVDPAMDLTEVLNGPLDRDIRLQVQAADGAQRDVVLRPISYAAARQLLYEAWIDANRRRVEELSQGRFGYLHIAAMNMESFHRFQQELYAVGAGRAGLIIDVRENGGGFTTDHLLTALTQPVHAITVPRGGQPGYPQDRKIYATWNRPIVVLCNQNSFSNAEIFSHAIKTLRRGPLVGVPTAGAVVSTGSLNIMDLGTLRMPTRGWFVVGTGQDMELHGAVPDHILWPQPTEWPRGIDRQLDKAVEVLRDEVAAYEARPRPPLIWASQRPASPAEESSP
jgi:tricorn protease